MGNLRLAGDNAAMNRPAAITSTLVVLGATLWLIRLGLAPDPFSGDAAAAVGIGIAIFSVVAAAGILLVRGRWVRTFVLSMLALWLALAVVLPLDVWTILAAMATGAAAVGLMGPWLRGWLRLRPVAGGPPWQATTLALGAVALTPIVGVASPSGLSTAHGVLAGAGLFLGWGYARTHMWGLWGLRLAIVPLAILAALQSPPAGAGLIIVAGTAITVLAWTRHATIAARPLLDRLPGPRVSTPRSEGTP